LDAVEYCHKKRIVHRDLKLGNILLDKEMTLKLSDFGLAAKLNFEDEKRRTMCGTPNYIAPEVLESKFGHSYEVDIWAIGVIIYTLIFGKPPFDTNDLKTTYKRIKACIYDFP
jgi:polo-like kinase 1